MKAIVCERYGPPDVLQLKEVPRPTPGPREVLVKVHAVSLNDWDWAYITGKPRIYRLMSGLLEPNVKILGSDIAGTVESVGAEVTKLQPGDAVLGDLSERWGGFAEYVAAHENALTKKPPSMSWTDAAAIPQAATLALQGLVDKGQMRAGMKLLINGAAGGVGTFGVQLAKELGIEVTGVDNTGKLELMKELGFDHVIDYTTEDFTRREEQYDLILDQKTNRPIARYLRALAPNGKYVTTGGSPARVLQLVIMAPLIKRLTGKSLQLVALELNKDLDKICQLYEDGKLKPVKDEIFPLDGVPDAFRRFGACEHKGKLVAQVA
ncbi:MAG: NAD(P)-dependent alcohol dehydrogenase [Myxococcales bacterium]|nr:NAD(P)-dependent alcohol dehydrogenase [Myxococcales bacterium]